ncbi:MAG: 16S rRNA (cytidine(1402)-2'-O)-methyltransferase, partial [Bacillota bacterium]|nr:16S rRNA (cytidine(1402)-2'-O)-methyltransferase [Bacillota bacterium]
EKGEFLAEEMRSGKSIALVSDAGTPAISDPGEDLVAICIEKGIDVVPIPGCVAAINALIGSGMATGRFCFEGFLSVNRQSRKKHLEELTLERRTMIFYEAPHKLLSTLKDFILYFGKGRKISLCRELTKIHEEFRRTTIKEALDYYEQNPPKGEFVLIVEGAPQTPPDFSEITIKEHVDNYIAEGLTEKDALKAVAKDRGIKKSFIYTEYKLK